MPGHHRVRFVNVPATPSSTYSGATLPSSPGLATPPSLMASPLPAKGYVASPSYLAMPPLSGSQVNVHPVLACTLGYGAPLTWDLTQPVESAQVRTGDVLPVTEQLVIEPATTPKVASITIICERLPWAITVNPTDNAPWAAPYVTVGDVLYTLYRTLRLPVTPIELGLQADPAFQQRVQDAYIARYHRITHPGDREVEKAKMIKRVDFLCEAQMFKGLSLVPEGIPSKGLPPGVVWKLHVARP
ncbi:hypothetical protein BD414DRAFT_497602 [Trametes punicea]|nr:hypothetical protein BD414DRAFT_497602 [Trametes punicea]